MDNIRPIKTETDYEWALGEIEAYFENEPEVGSADGDRFDVLATLIEAYEDHHYPIEAPDPVEAIRGYMELAGLKQVALAKLIGSPSRASEILSRKRPLTTEMVFKISQDWPIAAEVLVRPYHLAAEEAKERSRR